VADYATRTAGLLGLAPGAVRTLQQGARLHDIGTLTLSDAALGRSGPLTDAEREGLKQHTARGESMVAAVGFLEGVLPLIRSHHERWDGGGYPDGLSGPQIDPLARILTMADAYDAMLSPRPYRQARTPDEALDELSREAGTQFDPTLLESFREAVAGTA
jgi:diguanylate cyclase